MERFTLAVKDSSFSTRERDNLLLSEKLASEGIVLLKNNGMLPLKNKRIALFGSGARRTIIGGTGSGATHPRFEVGIEEGFKNIGFDIASIDYLDRYDAFYDNSYKTWKDRIESKVVGITDLFQILGIISHDRFVYPTGIPVEDKDIYSDVDDAIYVISRQAGEGADRHVVEADYLLDELEKANIKKLCESYKNVCILINVGGFIDLSYLDTLDNVNSILYIGQCGQTGGNAIAKVLAGEITPSGRLTATWPNDLYDIPSTKEFSENGDPFIQNFKEGIFVGYRYFDTFNVQPKFPFGYGLSYTTFETTGDISLDGEKVIIKTNTKNTGNYEGKEVIQVYVSIPEKNSEKKRLVTFGKTNTLKPNEEETLSLQFSIRDLTYFNKDLAGNVLEKGTYEVILGKSASECKVIGYLEVNETKLVEKLANLCPLKADFTDMVPPTKEPVIKDANLTCLSINTNNIEVYTHVYKEQDDIAPNEREFLNTLSNEDLASLVIGSGISNSDKDRVVYVMGSSGSTYGSLYKKYGIPNIILSDGPAGLNVTPRIVELPDGTLKSRDPYPQYDFGIPGKMMRTRMLGKPEDGVCRYQYATAWPCGVIRAQTWNTALNEEFGKAHGREMEELGVTVWLAPGLNLTRNTLCGRTFEYCSEDPVISGEIAASVTLGVQSVNGKGVSLKHFACNNSEYERNHMTSNVSERALRDLYLKGFEIAVKKANPMTVMASYNKINEVYNTNNHDLLIGILRNEWGFKNMVMSDWDAVSPKTADLSLAHVNGVDLVMPGGEAQKTALIEMLNNNQINKEAIIIAAHNVLKAVRVNTVVPWDYKTK